MTKAIFVSLTNPVSSERDAEYNGWFNGTHGPEVVALDGIRKLTRYRANVNVVPGGEPVHQYLAVYEIDDVDTALKAMGEAAPNFTMSDSLDFGTMSGVVFEKIFTLDK